MQDGPRFATTRLAHWESSGGRGIVLSSRGRGSWRGKREPEEKSDDNQYHHNDASGDCHVCVDIRGGVGKTYDTGMVERGCEWDFQHRHTDSVAASLNRGQDTRRRAYEMVLDSAEHCVQDRGQEQSVANALQQQRRDQIVR